MTFRIKNMVCDRCISTIREIFNSLGIEIQSIQLGTVVTTGIEPNQDLVSTLNDILVKAGFEVIEDKNEKISNEIKSLMISLVRSDEHLIEKFKLSEYLSEKLGKDYNSLSATFSSTESSTIEKYFIIQKIEYVKELLEYNELTLSEIAYKIGYSSVSHLSSQFKNVTGVTPTEYKTLPAKDRLPLDKL